MASERSKEKKRKIDRIIQELWKKALNRARDKVQKCAREINKQSGIVFSRVAEPTARVRNSEK